VSLSFLDPLFGAVAFVLVHIHSALAPIFGANSGTSWALAIVLLTVGMRLILFPLFVKQIRNQRAMQTIQPQMKELQTKYKNDKEKLNQEMMALWKESGANPLSGCLPLLLQIPIFIALFHTLRQIKPIPGCHQPNSLKCYPTDVPGFSQANIFSAAHAKIFGAPISADFTSAASFIHAVGGSVAATKVLCVVLTLLMVATTFLTQRQLMARSGPAANTQMAQTQKIMLYVFPLFFLLYGFKFPIGVLLYWMTTNVWSLGQQHFVIRRMEPAPAVGGAALPPAGPAPGAKPKPLPRAPAPKPAPAGGDITLPPGGAIPQPVTPRPSNNRRPANRSKNRKRGKK
jgi:YidC/Oxa1 family membrane protein insertase